MKKILVALIAALIVSVAGVANSAYANTSANAGAAAGASASVNSPVSIQSNGGQIPPLVQPVSGQLPNTAQVLGGQGVPTNVSGIEFIRQYSNACDPISTPEHELGDVYSKGASKMTQVVWSPNQQYYIPDEEDGGKAYKGKADTVGELQTSGKYRCLGVVTVTATEPGTVYTTILSDARRFPIHSMEGHRNIRLLSRKDVIAAAYGVNTVGNGLGIGTGWLGLAENVLSGGTVGVGYNHGGGETYADAKIGDTFLVFEPTDDHDPHGIFIDPDTFGKPKPVAQVQPKPQKESPLSFNAVKVLGATGHYEKFKIPKASPCGPMAKDEECLYVRDRIPVVAGGSQGKNAIPIIEPRKKKK